MKAAFENEESKIVPQVPQQNIINNNAKNALPKQENAKVKNLVRDQGNNQNQQQIEQFFNTFMQCFEYFLKNLGFNVAENFKNDFKYLFYYEKKYGLIKNRVPGTPAFLKEVFKIFEPLKEKFFPNLNVEEVQGFFLSNFPNNRDKTFVTFVSKLNDIKNKGNYLIELHQEEQEDENLDKEQTAEEVYVPSSNKDQIKEISLEQFIAVCVAFVSIVAFFLYYLYVSSLENKDSLIQDHNEVRQFIYKENNSDPFVSVNRQSIFYSGFISLALTLFFFFDFLG